MGKRIAKKIIEVGDSLGILLDKRFLEEFKLKKGDAIVFDFVMRVKLPDVKKILEKLEKEKEDEK